MPKFTTKVSSGGLLNIPKAEEQMHEFESGDLVTIEVVKHKKENGDIVFDTTLDDQ